MKEFEELGRGLFLRKEDYLKEGVSWEEDILGKKYSLERGFGRRIILELWEIMWRLCGGSYLRKSEQGNRGKRKG